MHLLTKAKISRYDTSQARYDSDTNVKLDCVSYINSAAVCSFVDHTFACNSVCVSTHTGHNSSVSAA